MKRITLLSAMLAVAAATTFGCSNKSTDKAMSETTAATETTMTESAAPVTAPEAKMAKVLVLKFHHDN